MIPLAFPYQSGWTCARCEGWIDADEIAAGRACYTAKSEWVHRGCCDWPHDEPASELEQRRQSNLGESA